MITESTDLASSNLTNTRQRGAAENGSRTALKSSASPNVGSP
jgi:hypothetical protein